MPFEVKDYQNIVASQIEYTRGLTNLLTDFNVGSVIRSIIEAHSIELDDLYQAMYRNLEDAIPTAIYQAFSFDILPATYSNGRVVFTLDTPFALDLTIPQGTVVKRPGSVVTYLTSADLIIPTGELSGSVPVVCDTLGAIGNTLPDTITEIVTFIFTGESVLSVNNIVPLTNGYEVESEQSRKNRFIEYVSSFSRATNVALTYASKLAKIIDSNGIVSERVTRVGIEEFKPGLVHIYIASGSEPASDELMLQVSNYVKGYIDTNNNKIAGYVAAGVEAKFFRTTVTTVPFSLVVYLTPGVTLTEVQSRILQEFDTYITSIDPGSTYYASKAIALLTNIEGINGVSLVSPSSNITLALNESLVRGATTLTVPV